MSRLLICLLALFTAYAAAAKELYLTVRRDFASSEDPVVEVNYTQKTPLTFRLYKPKDMKEFVASQIDLRRAWRQPTVELNSAKFLFSGLNSTRLQLDWLRAAANREMRDDLKAEYGGAEWSQAGTPLSEGPRKMISGPEKFELVSEFALYPDDHDSKTPFDVPGFDWWFQSYGGLASKPVKLPRVAPGFYLVQVVQGNLEGQVVLAVNDISGALQQTDGSVLLRVTRRSGAPLAGAGVEIRNLQGAWIAAGKSNADGIAEFKGVKDTELLAVIRDKDSTALIDTDFYSTTAVFPDVYLYTDRPMYRSGSKVRFKGILREQKSGLSRMVASVAGKKAMAEVALVDLSGGPVVKEVQVPLSRFGTFTGEFDLGTKEDLNGVYRVLAHVIDSDHVGEFRIKDYVKPLFFMKVATAQESLKAGSKLNATVSVQRFAGGVPAGVKYSAQLVRIRADTPQWVEDAGMGETGSTTTYGWDGAQQDSVSIPYPIANKDDLAFDAKGKSSLTLDIPAILPGPPNFDYKFVLKLFAKDDDGNNASATKSFLDLKSEVMAQARTSGVYAAIDRPAKLSVRAIYPSGKSYGKTKGLVKWIHTPYKKPPTTKEARFTTGADGKWEAEIPVDKPGNLVAQVTLFDRFEKPAHAETSILVAGALGEPVADVPELTMLSRRNVYAPGETAKALLLLPENWGEGGGDSGRLYVTVAGRNIHEQRVEQVKGLSTWLSQPIREEYGTAVYCVVSYSDPVRGWVERTLTLQIPPKNRALTVKVTPLMPLSTPGAQQTVSVQVTDAEKRPAQAELSVSVVDKALLTLQPEFRPALLAFFYPLERLNLMSFFSTQFQSYGYGELVAKRFQPNFWFSSTKPEQKVMKEDDTAYWSGQVVTDAQGQAKVTFRLPANQTTWNVSAVAADTQGRFGEGTGEFIASMPVMLTLSYPTFLRRNDSAHVRVILASQDPSKAHDVESSLVTDPALTIEKPLAMKVSLKPKQEAYGRALVKLDRVPASGTMDLKANLKLGKEDLQFPYPVRTLPDTVQFEESAVVHPGSPVPVMLQEKERLKEVKVLVATGFAGALLPSLKWLMGYPYGCVEQLVSSTVPNLFVQEVLEGQSVKPADKEPTKGFMDKMKRRFFRMVASLEEGWKGKPKFTKEQEQTLAQAAEFAKSGLQRLKGYQNNTGSLSWFPGGGEASRSMTLLVLMTLSSMETPSGLKALDHQKALGWLKNEAPMANSSQGIALSYIESRYQALGLTSDAGASMEAHLKFQGEWAGGAGTIWDKALWLLSLKYFGVEKKPALEGLATKMIGQVKAAAEAYASSGEAKDPREWTPMLGDWSDYPGRLTSSLAIAARALFELGALDTGLRSKVAKRLLESFDGDHFGSTYETSQALVHSGWLVKDELRRKTPSSPPKIVAGGTPIPRDRLRADPVIGGWEVLVPGAAVKGALGIEGLPADSVARLKVRKETNLDDARQIPGGWELKKEVYRMDEKTGDVSPLEGRLKVGDLVYVKLSFRKGKRSSRWWQSSYYVLSDLVPAGLTVVEEDKTYEGDPYKLDLRSSAYKMRDVRSDRVHWYFAFDHGWQDRSWQVGYVLRANYSGDFTGGIARMEDFYDETLYSQTASRRIGVDPLSDRGAGG